MWTLSSEGDTVIWVSDLFEEENQSVSPKIVLCSIFVDQDEERQFEKIANEYIGSNRKLSMGRI